MRTTTVLIASLLSAGALITAPAMAQFHPSMGRPHAGPSMGGGPSMGAPIHGAAPGHVMPMAPRSGPGFGFRGPNTGFRGGPGNTHMTVRPFTFQHRDFAHFSPAEKTTWQSGWWHHGWWHGRFGWWWFAGGYWWWYDAPIYPWPLYVSDVYYVEPTYEEDYGYWYYCGNPPGYYPYVQYCNGPWEPVPAQPAYDSGPQGGYDPGPQGGYDQGPPPGDEQGPPPGYDQGPPPADDQGPPPPNSGHG